MSTFEYIPLKNPSTTIRLLQVRKDLEQNCVSCELRQVAVAGAKYFALSYTWGLEPSTYLIKVNGRDVWIRPNLWSFLRYAQQYLRGKEIWVDAICINQDDISEKNQQVAMMGKTYAGAEKVVGWVHNPALSNANHDCNTDSSKLLADMVKSRKIVCGRKKLELASSALICLIALPYWSRAWIVQELELASKAEILWESEAFPWMDLKTFLKHHLHGKTFLEVPNYDGFDLQAQLTKHKIDVSKLSFGSFVQIDS